MKILLTGAKGQLGRALQTEMDKRRNFKYFPVSHEELDISNLPQVEAILDQLKPDVVINAAAYNLVDQAETDQSQAYSVNKTGPENLAKATFKRKMVLVHLSSDYVFDGAASIPYVESSLPRPISIYGKSKEAGEQAVLAQNRSAYIIRTAWVYHEGGRNFLTKMLSLKDKPELKVVNDQFGSPTYAPHLASKILDLLESNAPFDVYHLAGKGQATWFEFAQLFFKQMGISTPLKPIAAAEYSYRAPRPHYTVLQSEKGPQYQLPSWEQGVSEFVKELKNGMRVPQV
jgi:dTDP-4-dehydrorhamnose reductase